MSRWWVVAAFVVGITFVADGSPLRTCPSTCFCRHTPTVNKADCRDIPEWDLAASDAQVVRISPPTHPVTPSPLILSRLDMFPKVQMLSVTNRSIVELTSGNLPTLQVLDLSNNKISRFNERTFHHMPVLRQLNLAGNPISLKKNIPLLKSSSIRTLDLGYSGLTHIPNGSLSGIPNLTSLYLQGNPLKLTEGVIFVDRTSIQELDLSYCKLSKIPNHSLDNLVNLQRLYLKGNDLKTILVGALPVNLHYLDLSANRIRDVPIGPLSVLKNLTNLELAKNPVKCTCELITFLDRMSEQNVISEKMIVCAEPQKYAKVPWKDIDERELCKDDTSEEPIDEASNGYDEDDDSTSTSEKDDLSYETDGVPEEENRIMSQHPPPLSLQNLLQKPSRYQNMEENSIQSDQPYSNTSDEGADHMHDSPATTTETLLENDSPEKVDDLIVPSEEEAGTDTVATTESSQGASQELDVEDTASSTGTDKYVDAIEHDSLIVPASNEGRHDDEEVRTPTETHEEDPVENEKDKVPEGETTNHVDVQSNTPRDRETLENEKEQEEDLIKTPDASLAVEDRSQPLVQLPEPSEASTENPDSETFLKNEETIAMGKLMPGSKADTDDKKADHLSKADQPVTLESRTEVQEESSEFFPSTEKQENHLQSTEELHVETDSRPTSDQVSSTVETKTEYPEVVPIETTVLSEKTTTFEPPRENSHEVTHSNPGEVTERPFSAESLESGHSLGTETASHEPEESGVGVGIVKTSDEDMIEVKSEEHTAKPVPSESAENALENGEFPLQPDASTDTALHAEGDGESVRTHSDNETEHVEAQTEAAYSDHLNKSVTFDSDKTDTHLGLSLDHEPVPENREENDHFAETDLAATHAPAALDTSSGHDKTTPPEVPTSSPDPSDIESPIASSSPSSSTERPETPIETTPPPEPQTTTSHKEEENGGVLGRLFPFFSSRPKEDEEQDHISEPTSSDHEPEPEGSPKDRVSVPTESEPASFPSKPNHNEDLAIENNLARVSDSDVVVTEDNDVQTATLAYVIIAGVLVCVIIAVACVALRTRPDKKRKGSAPVRIRSDNVSPGTEMKDMMNPLLEPIAEGHTANEFHDDPTRRPSLVSLPLNDQNGTFVKENGATSNGGTSSPFSPISVDETDQVTQVVIEAGASNGATPSKNGLTAPANGKPPRQNGTKVKVVAGVITPAVPRTPVYIKKIVGDS